LEGNGNFLRANTVDSFSGLTVGFTGQADDTRIWGNQITTQGGWGIIANGDRYKVEYNSIQCADNCGPYSFLNATGHTTYALVLGNTVIANSHIGIRVVGNGARVSLNESRFSLVGMRIDDPAAVVGRNIASDNDGVNPGGPGPDERGIGILSIAAGTTIRNNTANNNTGTGIWAEAPATIQGNTANNNVQYGIDAAEGSTDGGGNTASGNGIQNCVNVACSSP
jgi:hypothetical protein